MLPEITLTYEDETASTRHVPVQTTRFSIGRGADNDLVIRDSNISRQHAVIESNAGLVHLSDCNSQNGTTLNAEPVAGTVELRDGDRITLGGAVDLAVRIRFDALGVAHQKHARQDHPNSANAAKPPWLNPIFVAVSASALLLLLLAVVLIGLTRRSGSTDSLNNRNRARLNSNELASNTLGERRTVKTERSTGEQTPPQQGALSTDNASRGSGPSEAPAADEKEQLNRAVKRVMSRISTDSTAYISEEGMKDIASQVNQYRNSAGLREKLRSMQRGCAEVVSLGQAHNLKPSLLLYAALAESENVGGDPLSVARQMAPKLLTLRATFGTETANSTLLLVAAYPYPFNPPIGSQTRTPHPLASKLIGLGGSHSVVDPAQARTVWFLREKNGITPEAYNLVIRLLAIGVIAQDPPRYGIDADSLSC